MSRSVTTAQRQSWMAILARAEFAELNERWEELAIDLEFEYVRKPEIGMLMTRGRVNGDGSAFNVGEVTVTRCTIKLKNGVMGTSYLLGRQKKKSALAAQIDAFLQSSERSDEIVEKLLNPLHDKELARQQHQQKNTNRSKVDFFTLMRGDD